MRSVIDLIVFNQMRYTKKQLSPHFTNDMDRHSQKGASVSRIPFQFIVAQVWPSNSK